MPQPTVAMTPDCSTGGSSLAMNEALIGRKESRPSSSAARPFTTQLAASMVGVRAAAGTAARTMADRLTRKGMTS